MSLQRVLAGCLAVALAVAPAAHGFMPRIRMRGANFVQAPNAPLDSQATTDSLQNLKDAGANTVAFIPFLWQARADSTDVGPGSAVTDAQLVAGIRRARSLGLAVVIKPHVWVEDKHWAGEIRMADAAAWDRWFAAYARAIAHYARIAQQEKVAVLSIGTEIAQASTKPQWKQVIAVARAAYRGRLTYVAHGREELRRFACWPLLDIVGLTLYEPLANPARPAADLAKIKGLVMELKSFSERHHKPLWVAELGVRSAAHAYAKPWESPEERAALTDLRLQAQYLDVWLHALDRPWIAGVLVWVWYSNPGAGGGNDTDFTPQNKPAEDMLRSHWLPALND